MTSPSFSELGLKKPLLDTLEKIGFVTPSPIQQEVIPLILSGADVVGQAQTGTGKTAAFGLPSIQLLKKRGEAQIVVITPTRELAFQVADELTRLGQNQKLKVTSICGGKSFRNQIDAFKNGAEVLVATPGRLLDLLNSKRLPNFRPNIVILDEADEMLNMGFYEDIQAIFKHLPKKRQTLLFSATMPRAIQDLIRDILETPVFVKTIQEKTTPTDITQTYYLIEDHERDSAVIRLFESGQFEKSIIFCKTKKEVDRLSTLLGKHGLNAKGLHGDMEQNQRQRVTQDFRTGQASILVATDVAARGLNILDVTHVINYHIPFDAESYVHRIGRTGRAGQKGVAITFVTPKEHYKLMRYQKRTGGVLKRGFVPSKNEVKKTQISHFIEKITEQSPNPELHGSMLKALQKKMDIELISCKLLAMLMEEKTINGPDEIGVRGEKKIREKKFNSRRPPFKKRRRFSSK
ncbi:MAG: DEAD-box ATP-dependent RNA helicase RhpA [Chlamydiales bacterium]|nr:DEAD-box ATP-dependent RNA helicase RhpA [Chlamydiales bacterium]